MIDPQDKIIVAVSGGADSVCLLDVLNYLKRRLRLFLVVAHVNHGIRGKESDNEAHFVRLKSYHFNLPFEQLSISVPSIAREKNLSIEQTGRILRYQFFKDLLKKYQAQKIALGHHMDDQVETILMRMIRGSGLQGLRGIPQVRSHFIRPLIESSRSEIEAYCHRCKIQYCVDSSNKEPKYLRNKIRHQLIPLLTEQYNSSVIRHLIQLQTIVQDELNFLEDITKQFYLKVIKKELPFGIVLDNQKLSNLPTALQRRVIRMGLQYISIYLSDIQFNHIESIRQLCMDSKGEKNLDLPNGIRVRKVYQDLEIIDGNKYTTFRATEKQNNWEYKLPICCTQYYPKLGIKMMTKLVELPGNQAKYIANTKKEIVFLDYDKLILPLKIRNRRPGDRFIPLNSQFVKKVKSYFIDQKIPRYQRDEIILVTDNNNRIVWITEFQLDDRFKITEQTKRILSIKKVSMVNSKDARGKEFENREDAK